MGLKAEVIRELLEEIRQELSVKQAEVDELKKVERYYIGQLDRLNLLAEPIGTLDKLASRREHLRGVWARKSPEEKQRIADKRKETIRKKKQLELADSRPG